jgi:CRP/FNR family cyclic AMP-dependent transcriptional regulator
MKRLTLVDKAFFLKKTLLFSALDLDLLLAIADKLNLVSFDAKKPIFSIGEEAFRMYFILEGTVEIRNEQGNVLDELSDENFFGDEALFNEKPRTYNAISKTDTVLLALSRTNLLTIISECPSVALGFLQAYTSATPFRHR